mmetsp:Transcript_13363/g.20875  ORF Transcript_13363/g.20875 Transcript_13363/m.20875 type:complete len:197 (-) Transcript_13363:1851-2441(-)
MRAKLLLCVLFVFLQGADSAIILSTTSVLFAAYLISSIYYDKQWHHQSLVMEVQVIEEDPLDKLTPGLALFWSTLSLAQALEKNDEQLISMLKNVKEVAVAVWLGYLGILLLRSLYTFIKNINLKNDIGQIVAPEEPPQKELSQADEEERNEIESDISPVASSSSTEDKAGGDLRLVIESDSSDSDLYYSWLPIDS